MGRFNDPYTLEREMTPPASKVDMVQMNTAIDKVLTIPARPKPAKQNRIQREAERPPPSRSGKNDPRSAAR